MEDEVRKLPDSGDYDAVLPLAAGERWFGRFNVDVLQGEHTYQLVFMKQRSAMITAS
jgi:hypothetical protein